MANKFTVAFDDIAEGRVRTFCDNRLDREYPFQTYGGALTIINALLDTGYEPLSPATEAVEALLRTAEKYSLKVRHKDES